MFSCDASGRWRWGIAVQSGAAFEIVKSILFRGVEEWVSGAEEVVYVGRHGEYLQSEKTE